MSKGKFYSMNLNNYFDCSERIKNQVQHISNLDNMQSYSKQKRVFRYSELNSKNAISQKEKNSLSPLKSEYYNIETLSSQKLSSTSNSLKNFFKTEKSYFNAEKENKLPIINKIPGLKRNLEMNRFEKIDNNRYLARLKNIQNQDRKEVRKFIFRKFYHYLNRLMNL